MATKDDNNAQKPPVEDTRDALEVLEAEAKEWEKDAEINRILQAFRLDA
jgi:DnaJ family protein C protein 8